MAIGNAIQAILLTAHAKRVVATDANARALAYATLQRGSQRCAERRDAARQLLRAGRGLSLGEALELLNLIALHEPPLCDPAARRWLMRLLEERPELTVVDLRLARRPWPH